MGTVQRWSGREARLLREALRMSQRDFAAHLGISQRTISKWEAGGERLVPVPDSQALLDTVLERAGQDVRERFQPALLSEQGRLRASGGRSFALTPCLEPDLIRRPEDYDSLLSIVLEASQIDTPQAVAIAGPGGFGKTTLANQIGHDPEVREVFPEILWVETGEDCIPARVVELISDLCFHLDGTRPALADPEQAGFHLARVIGDRQVLLVIDNVWSATDLSPFLLGAPRCLRLVTTRNIRVCPSTARIMRLGPMSHAEIAELFSCALPSLAAHHADPLVPLCGGWPLLATVVGANLRHDIAAGAPPNRAIEAAGQALRTQGPQAFDVWDINQRKNALGHAISASLQSFDDNVSIPGGTSLRDRYLSLAIFPAATPIPIAVLVHWWRSTFDWNESAVRQFCRILADRFLVGAHLADQDAIVLHDVFRIYLRRLVDDEWVASHRSLLDAFKPIAGDFWRNLDHEYLWRHLSYHLHEAGAHDELVRVLASADHVVAKALRCGHESLGADNQILVDAAPALTDERQLQRYGLARTLTGSGYLLHGLRSRADIVATLLVALEREHNSPELLSALRDVGTDAGFDVLWAQASDAADRENVHVGAVVSIAARHRLLVSGGEDGVLRMWDLDAHRMTHQSRGHTGWIHATAISADGELVASAGEDTVIRLWNARTGAAVGALTGHTKRIRSLAFTESGHVLVSGAEDGHIFVWDTDGQNLLRHGQTTGCPVWAVAVGCHDTVIATGGEDEFVRLFDLTNGHLLDEKAAHRDWIRSLAFAPGSPILASASSDSTVRVWTITEQRLAALRQVGGLDRTRSVALTDGASLIVTAGEDATLRAFAQDGLAGQARMPASVDWIRSIAVTGDGSVVAACEDGGLRCWEPSGHDEPTVLSDGSNTVWSTALADAGRLAVLGYGDGTINVRDAISTSVQRRMSAGPGRVWSLATGGPYIAAAGGDGTVRVWVLDDEASTLNLNTDVPRSWAVAVARTGKRLAASTHMGGIRVWDLPSGEPLWSNDAKAGRIRSLAFDGEGELLAACGGDGTVCLWRASTGQTVAQFTNPSGWTRAITVDHAGTAVAVGSGTGDIHVRDVTTGRILGSLRGHTGRVLLLGFAHEADRLVSAAADGTVRLWSLSRQLEIAQIRVDASGQCGSFDPTSGRLLVGSAAGVTALVIKS